MANPTLRARSFMEMPSSSASNCLAYSIRKPTRHGRKSRPISFLKYQQRNSFVVPNSRAICSLPSSGRVKRRSATQRSSASRSRAKAHGSESTPIRPPSCSMILWQIASPNPVPGTKELSLTKRSKICNCCSLSIPIPVSCT